jgi:hypothetical protein
MGICCAGSNRLRRLRPFGETGPPDEGPSPARIRTKFDGARHRRVLARTETGAGAVRGGGPCRRAGQETGVGAREANRQTPTNWRRDRRSRDRGAARNGKHRCRRDGCAEFDRGSAPATTGEINSTSTIILPPDWSSRSDDRLHRTFAHELGHSLGLRDNSGATSNSVMSLAPDCSSTTGLTLSPTLTDVLPVTSPTYAQNSRKACGF